MDILPQQQKLLLASWVRLIEYILSYNMADIDTWKRFVKEGDILYNYMMLNFNHMVREESITHFDIVYGRYCVMDDTDEIKNKYISEIQKKLILWIHNQGKDLFDYNNWIPFRDEYVLTTMFLGYRKMFIYKKYVFQLSLVTKCKSIHFVASLYGWLENNILQPDDFFTLPEDNIIPEKIWYSERKYCTGR